MFSFKFGSPACNPAGHGPWFSIIGELEELGTCLNLISVDIFEFEIRYEIGSGITSKLLVFIFKIHSIIFCKIIMDIIGGGGVNVQSVHWPGKMPEWKKWK